METLASSSRRDEAGRRSYRPSCVRAQSYLKREETYVSEVTRAVEAGALDPGLVYWRHTTRGERKRWERREQMRARSD